MNVAEAMVQLAVDAGTRHGFSVVGGMSMFINKAAESHPEVQMHYMHHETGCVAAAEGYSKGLEFATPGLAVITSGPAVTNAITGLASAYGDSVPILILAGQTKTTDIDQLGLRTHGVQEVRQLELAALVCKAAFRVWSPDLRDLLPRIWQALHSPRLGPIYVEIPLDVQSQEAILPGDKSEFIIKSQAKPFVASGNCAQWIAEAQRPVVLLGNGVKAAGAQWAVDALRQLGVPRLYTWLSFDLEDFAENLNLGCPGSLASIHSNLILSEADLVITVGARLDLATTAFQPKEFGAQARRVVVDIDPLELQKLHGCDETALINADADSFFHWLIDHLQPPDESWSSWASRQKKESLRQEDERLSSDELTVRGVALAMSERSAGKTIVPASSGLAEETFTRFFRPPKGSRFFNGAALGSMGMGLSHGLGAAWGNLDRPVWIVEADGGLWMQAPQLACLAESPLTTSLFVLNNLGYASIRSSQERLLSFKAGADSDSGLSLPDLKDVASAVRLDYVKVTKLSELCRLLDETVLPRVVDIHIPEAEARGPSLRTALRNGVPITPPLGSITW